MARKISFLIFIPIFLFAADNFGTENSVNFNPLKTDSLDVGVIEITAPTDTVDSNGIVIPSAKVKNFGTSIVNFQVIFRDDSSTYYDSKSVTGLKPDSITEVSFNMWRVRIARGPQMVKCSTALDGDANNSNDALQKSVFCRIKDIVVLELFVPDTIDSGVSLTPRSKIRNLGNSRETFLAIFRIGTSYNCTLTVHAPAPQAETTLSFVSWPSLARGTHQVVCTTAFAGDIHPNDNFLYDTMTIMIRDFGVTGILTPASVVPENSPITPEVIFTNCGIIPGSAKVTFTISDSGGQQLYQDSNSVVLEPGSSDTLTFNVFNVTHGRYIGKAHTQSVGDINPDNDTMFRYFFAGTPNRDVAVLNIIRPLDTILLNPVTPKATVINYGDFPETFYTFFRILISGSVTYYDSLLVSGLLPGRTEQITFSVWNSFPGQFVTECYTALEGDLHPENDLWTGSVIVDTLNLFWNKRTSMPTSGTKAKPVKAGGALAFVPPTSIYAFKGNNTNEFYCYDIPTDNWTKKETIPFADKKKRVKAGGGLCYDGERYVYALKGGNTVEFWRYDTQNDSWKKMAKDVPFGTNPKPKKAKSGTCIIYVPKSDYYHYVYLLKANGTFEFFAYWIEQDSWIVKTDAPLGPDNKKYKGGSAMAFDYNRNYIWLLKGGTNEFYAYDIITDLWMEDKPNIPLIGRAEKKKKVKDGGALAYSPATHSLYALKGGNTNEFWQYVPGDSWTQMDDMLSGEKRVKAGGALAFANGNLYALRGNKTNDFFVYNFGTGIGIEEPKINRPLSLFNGLTMKVQPNPFSRSTQIFYSIDGDANAKIPVNIKLYNTAGRMEKLLVDDCVLPGTHKLNLNSAKLPKGIYFLRLTALNRQTSQKLIITGE